MDTAKRHMVDQPAPKNQRESLWDIKDLASFLGVSRSTIRRHVRNREIPYRRIGRFIRFIPADMQAWVDQQRDGKVA